MSFSPFLLVPSTKEADTNSSTAHTQEGNIDRDAAALACCASER